MPRTRRYTTATARSRATAASPGSDPELQPSPHIERQPLSLAERRELLKGLGLPPAPGSKYVTLTPSVPSVPNRGALVFSNMNIVECGQGFAWWTEEEYPHPNPLGKVNIWLKLKGGRKYLVDVAVDLGSAVLPPSTDAATMGLPDGQYLHLTQGLGTQHLVALTEAVDDGWYHFNVAGKKLNGGGDLRFLSCEVTNL
jgi:hypothetical protein